MRAAVPRQGLDTIWRGRSLRALAREVVAIATDGLRARGRMNQAGETEAVHLAPLHAIAEGGPTQADDWLTRYRDMWRGDVRHIFADAAI
jgi:glutamate--cysteine ligase